MRSLLLTTPEMKPQLIANQPQSTVVDIRMSSTVVMDMVEIKKHTKTMIMTTMETSKYITLLHQHLRLITIMNNQARPRDILLTIKKIDQGNNNLEVLHTKAEVNM